MAKRPMFMQNIILAQVKSKIQSQFTRLAKDYDGWAMLTLDVGGRIRLRPGKCGYLFDVDNFYYKDEDIPEFVDPKFNPDLIINFAVYMAARQAEVASLRSHMSINTSIEFSKTMALIRTGG